MLHKLIQEFDKKWASGQIKKMTYTDAFNKHFNLSKITCRAHYYETRTAKNHQGKAIVKLMYRTFT